MKYRLKKGHIVKLSSILFLLLAIIVAATGCVRGQSPIGWSGVAISDNMLYAGSKEGRLVSLDLTRNTLQFADPLRTASSGGLSCFGGSSTGSSSGACGGAAAVAIYGSPAIIKDVQITSEKSGDVIVIAGYNGKVIAYDGTALSSKIWQYPLEEYVNPIVSGVTVQDKMLYFGDTGGNLYAIEGTRGIEVWKYTTDGEIWSTPTIYGDKIYFSSFDKKIYALNIDDGSLAWAFDTQANNVATPLVIDGVVYVGSLDRNFYAIDAENGTLKWQYSADNWFWAKAVANNGIVFAPCIDGNVYALNTSTGDLMASFDLDGHVSSSPIIINDKVIIATENGKLFSLDANLNNQTSTLISTIVEDVNSPLESRDNTVYINGPDNMIYAYDVVQGSKFSPVSIASE